MIGLLLAVAAAMAVVMAVGWLIQRRANNGGWTDVFWTLGTGATCALAALAPLHGALLAQGAPTQRQCVVAALVAAWSLRLGVYITRRVARGAEDVRYAILRRQWGAAFQPRMFGLMLVQAPATAILSFSILLAARNPAPGLGLQDLAGVLILIFSVVGEGVADEQMKRFRTDNAHKGRVCDTGLWAWSRHPNYFFEFVGWLAYPVIAFRPGDLSSLSALLAPVVMFLILRFGTGVPPLEAAMVESKGDAYRRYQTRVSPFLPRPPKALSKEMKA